MYFTLFGLRPRQQYIEISAWICVKKRHYSIVLFDHIAAFINSFRLAIDRNSRDENKFLFKNFSPRISLHLDIGSQKLSFEYIGVNFRWSKLQDFCCCFFKYHSLLFIFSSVKKLRTKFRKYINVKLQKFVSNKFRLHQSKVDVNIKQIRNI